MASLTTSAPADFTAVKAGKRAHILMVFAPKGGVGKTTLASNMVVAAARAGHSVAGLDFDGQRAFTTWAADRHDHPGVPSEFQIEVRGAHIEDWRSELHLVRRRDVVVIDTPPGVERRNQVPLQEIGAIADVILMPTEVYGGSMRYVVDFLSWWESRPGRTLLVLNKTIAGRSLNREAREFLSVRGDVWPDSLPLRDDIARAFDCGLAAADDDKIPGNTNFAALWHLCAGRMGVAT
jgi:chromosome partitioning protein